MPLAPHSANRVSERVIGAAIQVHEALGPGLLASTYQRCLKRELQFRRIAFASEVDVPIAYRGETLDCGYRLDLVVEDCLVVEIKSVEKLMPIHDAQLLTYLRLTRITAGLIVNFNVTTLRLGLRRLNLRPSSPLSPSL